MRGGGKCWEQLPRRAGPVGPEASAAARRVERAETGQQGTVTSGDRGWAGLVDSGLVLGAEAPFRVWFGIHNP